MRAADVLSPSFQRSQILRTETGYVHRNDPSELFNAKQDERIKVAPQFNYCKLSDDQIKAIKDRLAPELKTMKKTAVELRKSLPAEMITDKYGNMVTEHTFRRMVSRFRNELLMTKKQLRGMVNKLKSEGYSAMEVSEKLRNCVRPQYLRPILVECGYEPQKPKSVLAREMLAQGMSYQEINNKHPEISVKYVRALDAQMKKGQEE